MRAHIRHEGLTVDVYCREDDAVEGGDGREKQCSCQARVPEPFCLSSNDAGCYKDIVSIEKRRIEMSINPALSLGIWGLEFTKRRTYKTREPGPYWPDTGQAHTTCKALLVAFATVAFRSTRIFSSEVEESGGMTCRPCREEMALRQGRWQRDRGREASSVEKVVSRRQHLSAA